MEGNYLVSVELFFLKFLNVNSKNFAKKLTLLEAMRNESYSHVGYVTKIYQKSNI